MDRAPRRKTKPSLYNPEWMPNVAKLLCQRGATMAELAAAFNVANCTLYVWLNKYPELHTAVQVSADVFNHRVERALAERAIGGFVTTVPEVTDPETGKVTPAVQQYYPPDPTSCIFFLKNRMPDKYRDVHKVDNKLQVLKTSDELRIEILRDILELQAQGYDPKIIDEDAPQLSRRRRDGAG